MLGPNGDEAHERKRVDFRTRRSEAGWQAALDRFWKRATPLWFDWLEWVIILALISFVADQSHSLLLSAVRNLSFAALFFYLSAVFYEFDFYGFPLVRSKKLRRTFSLIVSGLVSWGLYLVLTRMVGELEGMV